MHVRVLRALLVVLTLLLTAGTARAGDRKFVILPGNEEAMRALFVGPPLAGGCRWDGTSTDGYVMQARYACADGALRVDLAPAVDAPPGSLHTPAFLVTVASGTPPPGFLDELVARLGARDSAWRWSAESEGAPPVRPQTIASIAARRFGFSWRDPVPALIAALVALAAVGLVASRRGARRAPDAADPLPRSERLLLAVETLAAVGVGLHAILHPWVEEAAAGGLYAASSDPWHPDLALRLLSANVYYWVAWRTGATLAQIVTVDVLVAALGGVFWALLLRRLGVRAAVAHGAACLWLATGAVHLQTCWTEGFPLIAGCTMLFATVLVAEASLDADLPRRARAGRVVLLIALAGLGVWVKAALVVLAVPTVLFMAMIRGARGAWGAVLARAALIAAAQGLAIVVSQAADVAGSDLAKSGVGHVGANIARIAHDAGPEIAVTGVALALALFASVPGKVATLRQRLRLTVTDGLSGRVGRVPSWAAAALLSGLWAAPFAANGRYCDSYYRILAVAPLLALAAGALHRAVRTWSVTVWLAVAAVLVFATRAPDDLAARDRTFHDFARDLRQAAVAMPEPPRVLFVAGCDDPSGDARAAERLSFLAPVAEDGVRWATGWRRAAIVFVTGERPAVRWAGEREARYCPGSGLRWSEPITGPGGPPG